MQTEPWRARRHILLCASKQFREGDVLHWWHWPGRGVRTRITDDRLFLPYVLWEYVHLTGDQSILTEQVSYLEGREIPGGAKDLYDDFADSSYTETLYQHCVRAVESIGFGSYGLPLMGGGDWNDGMDDVGRDGGESVWLGWFLLDVLDKMCCLAEICRRKADGKRFAEKARKLRHCVEQAGWDGAWYRRAYYGSGEPLGAKGNAACEIDYISQAWAAICGGEHADEAVNSMLSMLYDDQEGMIKLLTPPFTGQSWQRPRVYRGLHSRSERKRRTVHPRRRMGSAGLLQAGHGREGSCAVRCAESHKPRAHTGAGGKIQGGAICRGGGRVFRTQCRMGGLDVVYGGRSVAV